MTTSLTPTEQELRVAQKNFDPEYAKFGYENSITTLDAYGVNRKGVETALSDLIVIDKIGKPEQFMAIDPRHVLPSPYRPSHEDLPWGSSQPLYRRSNSAF